MTDTKQGPSALALAAAQEALNPPQEGMSVPRMIPGKRIARVALAMDAFAAEARGAAQEMADAVQSAWDEATEADDGGVFVRLMESDTSWLCQAQERIRKMQARQALATDKEGGAQ